MKRLSKDMSPIAKKDGGICTVDMHEEDDGQLMPIDDLNFV